MILSTAATPGGEAAVAAGSAAARALVHTEARAGAGMTGAAIPGGEMAVVAGSASAAAAARAGVQEAVQAGAHEPAPASTTAAAAHVTGTAAEWDSAGKY